MLNLSPGPMPRRELEPLPQPRWAVKARAEVLDQPVIAAPSVLRAAGQTRAFANVLGTVRHGLQQNDRLIVATGDSGTGKTLLCRALMEEAEPRLHMAPDASVIVIVDPRWRESLRRSSAKGHRSTG